METYPHRLRVGHLPTLYHTSFILMGTDLLKKDNVEAKWTLFPSGPDLVNAMCAAQIDIGYVGLPPAIIGIERGCSLVCVAGGHVEGTVLIGGADVQALGQCASMAEFLEQFLGRVIGCPPRGSIHDVIVHELLKDYDIKDVGVNNYNWADFLPDALVEGEIAAAAGTPALAVTARRYYGAHMIVPPTRLWPCNPSYGIVVSRETLTQRKGLIRGFLDAHETACEMIMSNPRKCAQIVARTTGVVDAGFMKEVYQLSPKYCASLPPGYIASTMKFVNALTTLGYISRRLTETDIFDPSLIYDMHPIPPHYKCNP
ncbi:MAG: ABC transporter substrate-binding protein [Halobacteriota archaeon]